MRVRTALHLVCVCAHVYYTELILIVFSVGCSDNVYILETILDNTWHGLSNKCHHLVASLCSRRATSMDLPMPMRFRHLKKTSKEAVGVYRYGFVLVLSNGHLGQRKVKTENL